MIKTVHVAKAIYETWANARGIDVGWDEVQGMSEAEGFPSGKAAYQLAMDEARAAIQAIREPSEGMERRGRDALSSNGVDLAGRDDSRMCWQAMIDQLLSEGSE